MSSPAPVTDFSAAIARSARVREIYHELEQHHHGARWTKPEDVVGMLYDVGELGRMVMAADGRWVYPGDLATDLPDKLAECLWWLFVLSDRLGVDLSAAFAMKIADLEASLAASLDSVAPGTGTDENPP